MDPLIAYLFPPKPKRSKTDDYGLILLDQCQRLVQFALGFWEYVAVANRKDYQDKMRLLVHINEALHYACLPSTINLSKLQTQVQIIDDEARRILEMVVWTRLDYDLAPSLNLVGNFGDHDLEIRGLGQEPTLNALISLGDAIKIYVRPEFERTCDDPDYESTESPLEEAILGSYRDGFSAQVGILNSPITYDLVDGGYNPDPWSRNTCIRSVALGSECTAWQKSVVSQPPNVLVGTNPRIHLLTSFEPNPQFYSLTESVPERDILFIDRRGAVRPFVDIQKGYGTPRKLYWTLYQFKTEVAAELDAPVLVPADLLFSRGQTTPMGTFQLEIILDIWERILRLEKQAGGVSGISWLLDVEVFSSQSREVPYYRKFASEYGLNNLSEKWGCQLYSPGVEPSPVFHGVLGSVHCGLMLYPARQGLGSYGGDHFLSCFIKDLSSININRDQAEYPQDLDGDPMTQLIRRWGKYHHPNVLSLFGIQQLPFKSIGVVLSQTHTRNLSDYLDMVPAVDRWQLCVQISSGLAYLHRAGVIHGNIKASNILVSLTGEAIVSDPMVLEENTSKRHGYIRWMAPEVVQGKPASAQSDVYSLGMWGLTELLYRTIPDTQLTIQEIITGAPPYAKVNESKLLDAILSGTGFGVPDRPEDSIPTHSKQGNYLWGLLLHCWSFNHDPKNRPNLNYLSKALGLITQDGLQKASPEEIAGQVFRSKVLREASYELSDAESVSSSSSNSRTNRAEESGTNDPVLRDQRMSNPGSQKMHMAREIIRRLALHGCENLTDHIGADSFDHLPLCRGGFGDVYRGNLLGGLPVAIKTPHISLNALDDDQEILKDIAREIHTWRKCDHPHVLHFLGLAVFRGQIGMVAPWMKHGSLPSYLRKTMSVDRCRLACYADICTEVCEGVAYLHAIGIVHGDLKGDNVLISSEGAAVVSDFGGSLLKNRSLKILPLEKGLSLTSRWAAPELFEGDEEDPVNTKESDIYALGMTILEAISGRRPWHWITRDAAVIRQVCSPQSRHRRPDDKIPVDSRDGDKLWDLLVSCWTFEPNARPTALGVGDTMRNITPGGLKAYCAPSIGSMCAYFDSS